MEATFGDSFSNGEKRVSNRAYHLDCVSVKSADMGYIYANSAVDRRAIFARRNLRNLHWNRVKTKEPYRVACQANGRQKPTAVLWDFKTIKVYVYRFEELCLNKNFINAIFIVRNERFSYKMCLFLNSRKFVTFIIFRIAFGISQSYFYMNVNSVRQSSHIKLIWKLFCFGVS